MWDQKLIRFLKRLIFYMLLLPLLTGLIYTLADRKWTAALVLLVLCVLILYKGLVRLRIPANSLVVRDDKVVFLIPEETVRDRFDFVSRGQTIVELPHYGLLDRPHKLEIFFPGTGGRLNSCRLSLELGYAEDLAGLQRAYDGLRRYQEKLSLAVKRELYRSAVNLAEPTLPQKEGAVAERLQPIVTELNRGLENFGLRILAATGTVAAAPTFARIVAAEQEVAEKP